MDPSLTEKEKRFVLAEMVKASKIDVDVLAMFVKANQIEPDWMSMQLPFGRNMNQCMQAAELMSILPSSLKRRPSDDRTERVAKRMATADRPEHATYATPKSNHQLLSQTPASHVAILPRPTNGDSKEPRPPTESALPKKRGRPSRADKVKKDLHPLLPRPATAQGPQALQSPQPRRAPEPMVTRPSNGLAALAPKRHSPPALLPTPRTATRPMTPPDVYVPRGTPSGNSHARKSSASSQEEEGRAQPVAFKAGNTKQPVSDSSTKRILIE